MDKEELLKMNLQFFADPDSKEDEGNGDSQTPPEDGEDAGKKEGDKKSDQEIKTYTQDELEDIIAKRVAREKKAAADKVAEAEKLAKMNADEKEKYRVEKLEKELEEFKKKDAYYSLSKEASKMLSEKGIQADDELLALIVKDDAEATKTAVNSFAELIDKKVQEGVKQALAGNSPKVNTNPGQVLTKENILAIKDSSERIRAIQENPQLFK